MENNLENKLSMYQKVQFYLALHEPETAAIPMVATLKEQLDDQVTSLLSLASIADTDITGYTVDKQTVPRSLPLPVQTTTVSLLKNVMNR